MAELGDVRVEESLRVKIGKVMTELLNETCIV